MKLLLFVSALFCNSLLFAQDLNWNTSAIPNNSLSFNFGSIGSPSSAVTYAVTGPGTITAGPTRFTTAQSDITWRTAITFGAVSDLKVFTLTFNPAVCGLTFILYDIDGNNTSGDRAILNANYLGSPQNITMTALDPSFPGGSPTITGSGTTTATGTGTQGNQTDDRVQISIPGCTSTLTIQYGNNPAGAAGGRSFSIGNLNWIGSTLPIVFTHFSGQKIAEGVISLKWNSEKEVNVSKFEVERSIDGNNFISAGFINTLSSDGKYTFTDNTPTKGVLFYRIKEIDLDGRFQYSSVIALKFNNEVKSGITIFPNPASHSIFITTKNNSEIQLIRIFDSNGKNVLRNEGTENNIDISRLPSGLYRVIVIDRNGDSSSSSFIKK